MRWAQEHRLRLAVHYCSLENKLSAQRYHQNAGARLLPAETLSPSDFFIKTARLYGAPAARAVRLLSGMPGVAPGALTENPATETVDLHPALLPSLAKDPELRDAEVGITYNMVEAQGGKKVLREVHVDVTTPASFDPASDL